MANVLVSGAPTPDVTGLYAEAGTHNGEPYYQRGSDDLYLFFEGEILSSYWWLLSTELGSAAPVTGYVWRMTKPNSQANTVEGLYAAIGNNCSGDVTAGFEAAILALADVPLGLPAWLPPALPLELETYQAEPTDWPPEETITVDKWSTPLGSLQPVRPAVAPGLIAPSVGLPPAVDLELRSRGTCELLGLLPWPAPDQVAMRPIQTDLAGLNRYYLDARGLYRVFNAAEYRFYRSSTSTPPAEGDTPWATSSSLPATPSGTFGDGTWLISCSYFNGVLDSGFLPIGPGGETYLRLDVSGGSETGSPPKAPADWRIEARPGGVVRVVGVYFEAGADAADEWAIGYTTDGSTPPSDSPDVTVAMPAAGAAILEYDLPAQSHGVLVRVRLQTRRNDGTEVSPDWVYSDNSTVEALTVDTVGPTAPLSADDWPGLLPEDL